MGDPRGDIPVLPDDMDVELNKDGWVEFSPDEQAAKVEAEAEEQEHLKQRHHKLYRPVDSGEDERGPYDVIPLSMVRGGEAKPTPVHTKPMKHLVLDQTIQPRGWYKNEIENDRTRPRPCYTEALLTSPYGGYCPVGCSFSFLAGTKILTYEGWTNIEDFKAGDIIVGRWPHGPDLSDVLATTHHKSLGYYRVELSNGKSWDITAGHLVWVLDRGWVDIADLYGNYDDVRLEEVFQVRKADRESYPVEDVLREMPSRPVSGDSQQVKSNQTYEAYAGLRELWESRAHKVKEALRQLSTGPSSGYGKPEESGQGEGESRQEVISRNKGQDEPGHVSQASQPGQGQTKEHRLEASAGGAIGSRQDGLLYIHPEELQGPQRPGDSLPLNVGVLDSGIFGPQEDGLDFRGSTLGVEWGLLPAGLYNQEPGQSGEVHRGQRILPTRPARADEVVVETSEEAGHAFGDMGQDKVGEAGYTTGEVGIIGMTYVPGEVDVYDIQTTSENFYAEGVLVHNCYINNGSRGYRSTGIPTVDPDYPEKYHEWLKKCMVAGAGYMTSFSEAFHPLEDTYHITQRLTNVFIEEGLPIFYCSRKLPADWAIEALQANPYSYMQWSINTSSAADFRKLSPGAASLDDMLHYIERLAGLNIYISIQCNPINAGVTTLPQLVELVKMLSEAGANHVIFKFVEQVANTRNTIIDRLRARRFPPERVDLLDRMFNQVIGGVYTIQQDIRVAWLKELLDATRKYEMTMSTCYEYYENGKGGANLAPYFTTSDQCHGRGIPVHYRPALGEKFKPLPGCFRKGCLYCAEHGTKACQSERLQQATALEYSDLRNTVITGREADWDLEGSCARPLDEPYSINSNPRLQTDAEMWGWPPLEEVLELKQKGPRDLVDFDSVAEVM